MLGREGVQLEQSTCSSRKVLGEGGGREVPALSVHMSDSTSWGRMFREDAIFRTESFPALFPAFLPEAPLEKVCFCLLFQWELHGLSLPLPVPACLKSEKPRHHCPCLHTAHI